jgi:hypothetical protein
MLIDSYALEDAVIDSGITERMMPALDDLGVVALGVLPDGLRRPIGVTGPILGPADWHLEPPPRPELAVLAPYVTSNVTLWPQMDVISPARHVSKP